jgi:hypothetical protein
MPACDRIQPAPVKDGHETNKATEEASWWLS